MLIEGAWLCMFSGYIHGSKHIHNQINPSTSLPFLLTLTSVGVEVTPVPRKSHLWKLFRNYTDYTPVFHKYPQSNVIEKKTVGGNCYPPPLMWKGI